MMLIIILVLSLVFLSLGFIINERNAPTLLSGFNMLSSEERAKVDLPGLIRFFRRFHIWFGLSFLLIELILWRFISEESAGIFMGIGPLLAYLYFVKASAKYYNKSNNTAVWAGVIVLIVVMVFVVSLFMYGFQESKIKLENHVIEISGMYGETLQQKDIAKVELIDKLPPIVMRSNGFASGQTRKGYFKIKNGGTVKLILNNNNSPFLLIQKKNGELIYYSSSKESNEDLFNQILGSN